MSKTRTAGDANSFIPVLKQQLSVLDADTLYVSVNIPHVGTFRDMLAQVHSGAGASLDPLGLLLTGAPLIPLSNDGLVAYANHLRPMIASGISKFGETGGNLPTSMSDNDDSNAAQASRSVFERAVNFARGPVNTAQPQTHSYYDAIQLLPALLGIPGDFGGRSYEHNTSTLSDKLRKTFVPPAPPADLQPPRCAPTTDLTYFAWAGPEAPPPKLIDTAVTMAYLERLLPRYALLTELLDGTDPVAQYYRGVCADLRTRVNGLQYELGKRLDDVGRISAEQRRFYKERGIAPPAPGDLALVALPRVCSSLAEHATRLLGGRYTLERLDNPAGYLSARIRPEALTLANKLSALDMRTTPYAMRIDNGLSLGRGHLPHWKSLGHYSSGQQVSEFCRWMFSSPFGAPNLPSLIGPYAQVVRWIPNVVHPTLCQYDYAELRVSCKELREALAEAKDVGIIVSPTPTKSIKRATTALSSPTGPVRASEEAVMTVVTAPTEKPVFFGGLSSSEICNLINTNGGPAYGQVRVALASPLCSRMSVVSRRKKLANKTRLIAGAPRLDTSNFTSLLLQIAGAGLAQLTAAKPAADTGAFFADDEHFRFLFDNDAVRVRDLCTVLDTCITPTTESANGFDLHSPGTLGTQLSLPLTVAYALREAATLYKTSPVFKRTLDKARGALTNNQAAIKSEPASSRLAIAAAMHGAFPSEAELKRVGIRTSFDSRRSWHPYDTGNAALGWTRTSTNFIHARDGVDTWSHVMALLRRDILEFVAASISRLCTLDVDVGTITHDPLDEHGAPLKWPFRLTITVDNAAVEPTVGKLELHLVFKRDGTVRHQFTGLVCDTTTGVWSECSPLFESNTGDGFQRRIDEARRLRWLDYCRWPHDSRVLLKLHTYRSVTAVSDKQPPSLFECFLVQLGVSLADFTSANPRRRPGPSLDVFLQTLLLVAQLNTLIAAVDRFAKAVGVKPAAIARAFALLPAKPAVVASSIPETPPLLAAYTEAATLASTVGKSTKKRRAKLKTAVDTVVDVALREGPGVRDLESSVSGS